MEDQKLSKNQNILQPFLDKIHGDQLPAPVIHSRKRTFNKAKRALSFFSILLFVFVLLKLNFTCDHINMVLGRHGAPHPPEASVDRFHHKQLPGPDCIKEIERSEESGDLGRLKG